jgi:hypothetical protein
VEIAVVGKRVPSHVPKAHWGHVAGLDHPEEVIADLFLGEGPIVGVCPVDDFDKLLGACTHQILHVFLLSL